MNKDTALYIGNDQRLYSFARYLNPIGIKLYRVPTIPAAEKILQEESYDLVLIQYEMFRKQILDIYSFIRQENHSAVIMVLMEKLRPKIETLLFNHGVDDVVFGKQNDPLVLASRIKRRFYNGKLYWGTVKKIMFKGGVLVNLLRRETRINGCTRLFRSTVEILLCYFLDNPDRIITRDELWKSNIWDMTVARADKEEEGKTFDMAIGRLRKAIEIDPKNPQIIKTVHGKGWILAKDALL